MLVPKVSIINGIKAPDKTIPNPPPEPNNIAIAKAFFLGSLGNKPAVRAPAVEKDIAPKMPARILHNVCHHISAFKPVTKSVKVVVIKPKAKRWEGEYLRISSIVKTAPIM